MQSLVKRRYPKSGKLNAIAFYQRPAQLELAAVVPHLGACATPLP